MKVIENVTAPKRKRYNKNKKKAWRKKAQIKEIEDFLEDQRREERYGGPLEEKQDKELMFLDTGADPGESKVQPVTFAVDTRRGHNEGFKSTKHKKSVKVIHNHRFLSGLQGAKTPHKEKTKEDKVKAVVNTEQRKTEVLMKKRHIVKRSRAQVRQIRAGKKPLKAKVANRMEVDWTSDPWDANSNQLVKDCKENDVDDSFADAIVKFHSITTKVHAVKVPEWRYKQTSSLPSVAAPDPGQSYNPSFEDHQNLLRRAVKQQLKIRQEEGKYKGLTTAMFPTIDEAPTEESWLAEMSEGLPTAENASEEESEGDSDKEQENEATVSGKKTTEKKTKKQRKKEKKQKWLKRNSQMKKEKRVRESNVFRVKTYKKEIKETEELLKARHISRKAQLELKKSKPRRLGKLKYQPEDIAISVGNELSGSLRTAKPVVSLMDERFKNFQRRNLLEPRLPVKGKKKPKTVMKRDHRKTLEEIEKMAYE